MKLINSSAKTNTSTRSVRGWKYLAIACIAAIFLVGAILFLRGTNYTPMQTTPSIPQDLNMCTQESDCILVDYYDCCLPPQRAINKKYKEEYMRHPEWQRPSEKRLKFCERVLCAPPELFDAAKCVNNRCLPVMSKGNSDEKIDTSAWQTYRNEEFGFEFRYPSTYEKELGYNKFYRKNPRILLEIGVVSFEQSLDEYIDQRIELNKTGFEGAPSLGLHKREKITVSDKAAVQLEVSYPAVPGVGIETYIQAGRTSAILLQTMDLTDSLDFDDLRKDYDQILSTFRFISSQQESPTPQADTNIQSIIITEKDSGKSFSINKTTNAYLRLSNQFIWSKLELSTKSIQLVSVNYLLDPGFSEWVIQAIEVGKTIIRSSGAPNCSTPTRCSGESINFEVVIIST